jgi:diguanylate cyclase (GGDEF)-like protein
MSEFDRTLVQKGATAPVTASTSKRPCLTFLSGGPVGLVYTLAPGTETLIGRGGEADIPIEEPRVSRRHAVFKVNSNGHVTIEDQGSSNGTFVNGERVEKQQELEDGDRIQVGYDCIIKFSYQDDLEYQLHEEIAGGIKDPVTGIYTQKYLQDRLKSEFNYAQRHKGDLGTLAFVVDQFSDVSLWHGLSAGDLVLTETTRAVAPVLRAGDVFARCEGDRFMVLARDLNDESAHVLAERIRKAVEEHQCEIDGKPISLTVTIGITTLTDGPRSAADLLRLAEKALLRTKIEVGKNGIGRPAVSAERETSHASPTVLYQQKGKA